jgi:acyl-CoA thioester hydrolase
MTYDYIHKIQFYETDAMGVVHHSNYIRFFEEARVDFMDRIGFGYEKSIEAGIDIPVLSAICEYKSMAHFGESLIVSAKITHIMPTKMTVSYCVTDFETGNLRATGETRHCFFSRAKGRPTALSKELPDLYELFQRSVQSMPDLPRK